MERVSISRVGMNRVMQLHVFLPPISYGQDVRHFFSIHRVQPSGHNCGDLRAAPLISEVKILPLVT